MYFEMPPPPPFLSLFIKVWFGDRSLRIALLGEQFEWVSSKY